MTVAEILSWVLGSGGAMALGYLVVDRVPKLAALLPDVKRYVAFALAFVFANAANLVQYLMGYTPWPGSAIEWIEVIVLVGSTAIVGGQLLHASIDLKEKSNAIRARKGV